MNFFYSMQLMESGYCEFAEVFNIFSSIINDFGWAEIIARNPREHLDSWEYF